MTLHYSAASGGFYDTRVHASLPDDAVAISAARHAQLMAGQAAGRPITAAPDGSPVNAAPVVDTSARRARLVAAVKREAAARILAVAPIWRQLNDARDLPLAEGAARTAIEARYAAIDAIRAASDALEARIAAAGPRALAQLDIAAPSHWPR